MIRYLVIGAGLVCLSVATGVALVLSHDATSGQRRLASLASEVQPTPAMQRDAKAATIAVLPGTPAKSISVQAVQPAAIEATAPSGCCTTSLAPRVSGPTPPHRETAMPSSQPAAHDPQPQPLNRQAHAALPDTVSASGAQAAKISLPPQLKRRDTLSAVPDFFIGVYR